MSDRKVTLAGMAALVLLTAACTNTPPPVVMSEKGEAAMRAMETRIYPVADKGQALRSVIATLQDLGYNVDRVRGSTGTATAVKLAVLRISVAVTRHGSGQMAVRANAEVQTGQQYHQVDEPAFYEDDFFAELSKTMALTATPDANDGAIPLPDSIYSDPKS
jgi:hypothetical protein